MARLYFIAGEASGDLHGSNLIAELFKKGIEWRVASGEAVDDTAQPLAIRHTQLVIRAWGGDRMAAAGAEVVKHYRELAFMGFTQVVMNLRTILRNIRLCKEDIAAFKPDALVLIDYPGFNLRIADWARTQGIQVFYYISPQLWAWKENRIAVVKRAVDRMFCILPFEKDWYAQRGVDVDFVGHPLLDELAKHADPVEKDTRDAVAILPGSRTQEITRMLPVMLDAAKHFPTERFVVAAAPSVPEAFYRQLIGDAHVELVAGRTYDLLREAKAAIVTSGTATLETALFGVPEVVCYSGSSINVWLARRLVKVRFISLVNLIMDREAVKELVQQDMNADTVRNELDRLLNDRPYRERMIDDLRLLREKLGGPGASARTAELLWKSLKRRA
ncbi:MAG TPA: lipid-A-disaccharide synthase [Flavobacteriales bacterium]|nr:lipid-A-disaccharide synthase [Flavobacteriales bacterium]HNI03999.1 lipid-A-disaccharide synthase [Flavobacteriales bacterium]HNK69135.1 lipid-A-disaccharide synthase [Flavobacteriales bacterium]HNK85940.1 lipid-A-disaccharide synthase [Flavobacteriales bacterium]HNM70761.1 lipid-A-disaccharide synthase [Flavobacteriales bacterium]